MYLALFLTPWVVIYALSGLVLNHHGAFRELYGGNYNRFEQIDEREYATEFSHDTDPKVIGQQILADLDLTGGFWVQGTPAQDKMVVHRDGGVTAHRISYFPKERRLVVERQEVTAPTFVNRVHFRHGYEQPFLSADFWGFMVDLVVVSMTLWILTGLWMWWEIRPGRKWGAVFGLVGLGVFFLLMATI